MKDGGPELVYMPMSLSRICEWYAARTFKKELAMTKFFVDAGRDTVVFELLKVAKREER